MRIVYFILFACLAKPASAQSINEQIDIFTHELVVAPASPEEALARCSEAASLIEESIDALQNRSGPATVAGDLRAYDDIQRLRQAAGGEAQVWLNLNPDRNIREAAQECGIRLRSAGSPLTRSQLIYDRLSAIPMETIPADLVYPLQRILLGYRLRGLDLDPETLARIQEINGRLGEVSTQFARNIAEGGREGRFSVSELEGLPPSWFASRDVDQDGMVTVTTALPDARPVSRFAANRETRRRMAELGDRVAFPENEQVLREMINLRNERAQLLGFDSHAEYQMADMMMGSPENAREFLDGLHAATAEHAATAYAEILAFARRDVPSIETLDIVDGRYYLDRLIEEKYEVDPLEVREYFRIDDVREGVFGLMGRMFEVEFRRWDTPVWAEGVSTWEVYEGERLLGRFYLDLFPREGKYPGGAQFSLRSGLMGSDVPVSGLMANFPRDEPMDHGFVIGFLHEFGHLMHDILGQHQSMTIASRNAHPLDFIEVPSQFLEEWAWDYETLATFARNQNGEPIPQDLVERMNRARHFGLALRIQFGLGLSSASLAFFDDELDEDFTETYNREINRYSVAPRNGGPAWASWTHLNGYSSNYYLYTWSEVLARDLLSRFDDVGLNDRETALAYRDIVLEGGGSQSPSEMIEEFLGRPVSYDSFIRRFERDDTDNSARHPIMRN